MNTKEYIESGILEAFAVGSVTKQERQEVECLSKIYPEIKLALEEVQQSMEGFATEYALAPPPDLKSIIMAKVANEAQIEPEQSIQPHSIESETKEEVEIAKEPEAKVKKLRRDPSSFPWRIAATVLLVLSCGLLYFVSEMDKSMDDITVEHERSINFYENKISGINSTLQQKSDLLALTLNKGTERILLNGTETNSTEAAIVYWQPDTKQVWLDPESLSAVDDEHQYQLWALKDGQPIDLGVVVKSEADLIQMKSISDADAFAITLEPHGGSPGPTLSNLKVLGEI